MPASGGEPLPHSETRFRGKQGQARISPSTPQVPHQVRLVGECKTLKGAVRDRTRALRTRFRCVRGSRV